MSAGRRAAVACIASFVVACAGGCGDPQPVPASPDATAPKAFDAVWTHEIPEQSGDALIGLTPLEPAETDWWRWPPEEGVCAASGGEVFTSPPDPLLSVRPHVGLARQSPPDRLVLVRVQGHLGETCPPFRATLREGPSVEGKCAWEIDLSAELRPQVFGVRVTAGSPGARIALEPTGKTPDPATRAPRPAWSAPAELLIPALRGESDVVDVVLRPAAQLTGRVVDTIGRPVPHAPLRFRVRTSPTTWGTMTHEAIASADGAFVVEILPERRSAADLCVWTKRPCCDVLLRAPTSGTDWVLDDPCIPAAIVVQDESGRPVSDATVFAAVLGTGSEKPLDLAEAAPGRWTLVVHRDAAVRIAVLDSHGRAERVASWRPGSDATRVFTLPAPRTLRGALTDRDGVALAPVRLACDAPGALAAEWPEASAFEIRGVPVAAPVRVTMGDPPVAFADAPPGVGEVTFAPWPTSRFALAHPAEDPGWLDSGITVRLFAGGRVVAEAPARGGVASFDAEALPERVDVLFASAGQHFTRAMTGVEVRSARGGLVAARPAPFARFVEFSFRRADGRPRGAVEGTLRHANGFELPFRVSASSPRDFADFPLLGRWTLTASAGGASVQADIELTAAGPRRFEFELR